MYTMNESVAVTKVAETQKDSSPTRSDNSSHRAQNEPEMQLGSLRGVINTIRLDGGTPSVDSIATQLSGMTSTGRASVLQALQQTHGNLYVQQVVLGVQAKLMVGLPNDRYEQEADRVADTVMRTSEPEVQRQLEEEEEKKEDEELVQTKTIAEQITPVVQRQVEEEEEEEEELIQPKPLAEQITTLVQRQTECVVVQSKLEKSVSSSYSGRYVHRVAAWIQAKLKPGPPNDRYEQEADLVADTVMRTSEPLVQRQLEEEEELIQTKTIAEQITPLVQRQVGEEEEEEEEELIQPKPLAEQITPLVQRQPEGVVVQSKSEKSVTSSYPGRYLHRVAAWIQAKLKPGPPNDRYEQEVDRVADTVMRTSEPQVQRQLEEKEELVQTKTIADQNTPLVQRQVEEEVEEEEEELIQPKPLAEQITPLVQRQPEGVVVQSKPEKSVSSSYPGRYVHRVAAWIQAKLKPGPPNDRYEQEADRVADEVMRAHEPQVQRQLEEEEEEKLLQAKQDNALVQRQPLGEEKLLQTSFLEAPPVAQTKLIVCAQDDEYEREADRVAETVMRMPATPDTSVEEEELTESAAPGVQRMVEQTPEEESIIQPKRLSAFGIQRVYAQCTEELKTSYGECLAIQTKAEGASAPRISPDFQRTIQFPNRGLPLPDTVRSRIEPVLGADLGNVRVHSDANSNDAAKSLQAKAFTHQNHIWLASGQSSEDITLMAHEATHVVQQSSNTAKQRLIQREGGNEPLTGQETITESARLRQTTTESESVIPSQRENPECRETAFELITLETAVSPIPPPAETQPLHTPTITPTESTRQPVEISEGVSPVSPEASMGETAVSGESSAAFLPTAPELSGTAQAESTDIATILSREIPSEPSTPSFDYDRVTEIAPENGPLITQIRELTDRKKSEISVAARLQKDNIYSFAEHRRNEVIQTSGNVIEQIRGSVEQARSDVMLIIEEQQTAVQQALQEHKDLASRAVESQAQRLATEGNQLSDRVIEAANAKRAEARELGEAQSQRAYVEVTRQVNECRRRGDERAQAIQDADPDRQRTQQNAVRQVANEQARDIQETASEIAEFAEGRANEISANFVEQAQRVSQEITRGIPRGQGLVRSLDSSTDEEMDRIANTVLDALSQIEQEVLNELDQLETASVAQIEELVNAVIPQIDALAIAACDQIDVIEHETHAQLDLSAVQSVANIVSSTTRITPEERFAQFSSGQEEIVNEARALINDIVIQSEEQLWSMNQDVVDGMTQISDDALIGIRSTVEATNSSAVSTIESAMEGFQLAVDQVANRAQEVVDGILDGFRQSVEDTIREFNDALTRGRREIIAGVNESLARNDQAIAQLATSLPAAAARAASEYDRPWWAKALIALGKGILFLAAAIVAIFLLAVLIFVVGLLLVKAGIIAAITFVVALTIAVIVFAVGFVIYEFVQRLEAYKAEHGPVDSFWKALGVSFALLGISIASLTGIPQIIEGFGGKRFFSDIELSSQERYDLVIGGFLILITLGLARLAVRTGGGRGAGRGGRGRAGIFERINRFIERKLERWILGEERGAPRPEEVPHGKTRPEETRPEEPRPEEARPKEEIRLEEPEPARAPSRELGLRKQVKEAIETLENIKQDPLGPVNRESGHNHYVAARMEAGGEVVARRPDGRPFNHIRDLQEAFNALQRVRRALEAEIRNPPFETMTERGLNVLLERYAEVQSLISRLRGFLHGIEYPPPYPPFFEWPPGT